MSGIVVKKLFFIMGVILFGLSAESAAAGPAFESLLAAAGSDATLPAVFDGAAPVLVAGMQPVFPRSANISAAGAVTIDTCISNVLWRA